MSILDFIKQKILNRKISNKLVLYSTGLLLCSLLSIGITSYVISSSTIKNKISSTNIQILRQTAGNMDFVLKGVENVFKQVFDNIDLSKYLSESDSSNNRTIIVNNEKIMREISKFLNLREEVEYIYIADKTGVVYTNDRLEKYNPINLSHYNEILQDNYNGLVWTFQNKKMFEYSESARIALCRAILDKSGNYRGFIVILLKEEVFNEIYANLCNNERQVLLVENGDIIVSCSDSKKVGYKFNINKNNDEKISYISKIDNTKSLVSYVVFEHANWKLYMVEPYESIVHGINRIRTWIIITICICILISIILSILFSSVITKRIKNLLETVTALNHSDMIPERTIQRIACKKRNIIKRIFLRYNFKTKLSIVLASLVVLPIIVSMTVTYGITSGIVKENVVEMNMLKTRQVARRLENYFKTTEKSLNYIYFEKSLTDILGKDKYLTYEDYESDKKIIESVLNNIYSQNRNIIYANLYKLNGDISYSLGFGDRSITQDMLMTVKEKDTVSNTWFGAYKDYYNAYVITLGRKIRDINHFTDWGCIFVSIRESDIADIYDEDSDSGDFSFIIDDSGIVISHNDKSLLGKKLYYPFADEVISGRSNNFIKKYSGYDLLVNYESIKDTGWKVVSVSSVKVLEDNMKKMLIYNLLVFIFSTIVVVMLVIHISNKISMPINELTGKVKKFAANDLEVDRQINTGDEIEELSIHFEKMMKRIKTLIEEVYEVRIKKNEAELEKKEAELTILQAQINPHFLYNTLEIIRWEAMNLTNGENKVTNIVTSLSKFFRLSLSKGMKFITIKDEIEHVINYVKIMNVRYDDIVIVNYSLDDALLSCLIPKLTLQPIVENAINHGIAQRNGSGNINITGTVEGEEITIIVKDNGIGISECRLEELRNVLNDSSLRYKAGYGLKNINQRIKLYFGNEYGLYIESKRNEYTTVTIRLKKSYNEPEEAR